jgi:light-regulated signal transduction histidine kinase (bacteriophytochrome)
VQSQFVSIGAQVDVTNCDREPIHAPGSVQPHGALFALDPTTERVLAVSSNAYHFIGEAPAQTVNALAIDVFGAAGADRMRMIALALKPGGRAIAVRLPQSGHLALMHRAGQTVFLELEAETESSADLLGATRNAVRTLVALDNVDVLSDAAAEELRSLTGYDRVMVYRFDPDGHGSVIAESRTASTDSYLGQHYPASDIPRQARALYRTTMLRMIVDVDAAPAELQPLVDPRTGEPWDLGRAILRSSSPIHLQYLRNMGVTATMTISLMREGELWGLIACHHFTPKSVNADVRAAAETLGHALVARIVQLEDARENRARTTTSSALVDFMMHANGDRLTAIVNDNPLLLALGVDGAMIVGTGATSSGSVLDADTSARLVAWLEQRAGSHQFVTDSLPAINPDFTAAAEIASGLFARRCGSRWFLAFRAEDRQTVEWGGDPTKAVETNGERLSPRGSFETWKEEVRYRAEPWEPWVLDALERCIQWAAS